jgi:hypothetical protein
VVALACVEGAAQVAQAEPSQELDPGRVIWAACNTRASACDDQQPQEGQGARGVYLVLPQRRALPEEGLTTDVGLFLKIFE